MSTALIRAIKERPVIWSPKHPQYNNKAIVNKAWEKIRVLIPQCGVSELKRKWKQLRAKYKTEMKKAIRQGETIDTLERYQTTWPYFKLMTFLGDYGVVSNFSDKTNKKEKEKHQNNMSDVEESSDSHKEEEVYQAEKSAYHIGHRTINVAAMKAEYLEVEKRKLKLLESQMNKQSEPAESDDYHFLMSLVSHMENLDAVKKLKVRIKINNVFIEELQELQET